MRNQTSFRLTSTLLPTDLTAKTTTVINKVDANGNKFYPTFTEETVVLTNDDRTIMETTKATCNNGVLTFVKRGLSDDQGETQITNRKLTRNPGSLCFITAGAADWIDKDDDIVWAGNQTYNGSATYEGALVTNKGVKYPSFANIDALEAYGSPFGGMFATLDSTGELYRYNAVTEQRDLVSTVELGQYIIRESQTAPAEGTASNIVTLSPNLHGVYLGTNEVVKNRYVDVLVVGGGGGGAISGSLNACGGGGGGGVVFKQMHSIYLKSYSIIVGAGGATNNSGGYSKFGDLIATGGGAGDTKGANGGGKSKDGIKGNGIGLSYTIGHNGGDLYYNNSSGGTTYQGGQGGSVVKDGESSNAKTIGAIINIGGQEIGVSEGGGGGYNYHSSNGSIIITTAGERGSYHGSGGGGSAFDTSSGAYYKEGSAGNAGVVAIAYPSDGSYGFSNATGGIITTGTMGGVNYKTHIFTANGTFTIIS